MNKTLLERLKEAKENDPSKCIWVAVSKSAATVVLLFASDNACEQKFYQDAGYLTIEFW